MKDESPPALGSCPSLRDLSLIDIYDVVIPNDVSNRAAAISGLFFVSSIIILLFIIVLLFTNVFNILEKWNRLKEFRATYKSCANV